MSAGDHLLLRISKQMFPLESMLGWKTLVRNLLEKRKLIAIKDTTVQLVGNGTHVMCGGLKG